MDHFHTYFDQIYLICPKWNPHQKLLFLQKLNRLGIQGMIIEGREPAFLNDLHRQVLTNALHQGHRRILMLQDDNIFHSDFHHRFSVQIRSVPQDWKLLFLGDYLFEGITGDGQPSKRLGAFAVGIHLSIFQRLLDMMDRVTGTLDAVHFQKIKSVYPDLCPRLEPPLVIGGLAEAFAQKPDLSAYDDPFKPDLVSIIMPVYNRAGIVEKAIRSSLGQSYPWLEIVVVDDASTDDTVRVIKGLMAEDDRVRLIQRAENGGVGLARNDGIRAAKGVFIAFHDSDDMMMKDRLVKQLLPFYDKGVLFTLARVIRSHCYIEELSLETEAYNLDLARSRTRTKPDGFPWGDDRERIYPATAVFRKEVFEKWGLYWDARYAEDYEMIERILYHRTGIHFGERPETPLMYLEKTSYIRGVFDFIPEVLCIASKRQKDNLTVEYLDKQAYIVSFKETYRNRLLGKGDYNYSQLRSEDDDPKISFYAFENIDNAPIPSNEDNYDEALQALNICESQLRAMQQSISWRITKPLRRLGEIFKR